MALTVETVCAEASVEPAAFYAHFESPEALLPAYYDLVIDQYRLLTAATEGYQSFTVEEQLASFYYIVLDTLDEHRKFVKDTFESRIRTTSSFRSDARAALREILTDERIPQPNQLVTGLWPVHEVLTEVTFAVIRHWMSDETEGQAATTALVDRLVAFVAELVTFRGVSTGLDLAWYVLQHDALGLSRLPLVGWVLPRPRDRTDE